MTAESYKLNYTRCLKTSLNIIDTFVIIVCKYLQINVAYLKKHISNVYPKLTKYTEILTIKH